MLVLFNQITFSHIFLILKVNSQFLTKKQLFSVNNRLPSGLHYIKSAPPSRRLYIGGFNNSFLLPKGLLVHQFFLCHFICSTHFSFLFHLHQVRGRMNAGGRWLAWRLQYSKWRKPFDGVGGGITADHCKAFSIWDF